jgi:hypothetical protein
MLTDDIQEEIMQEAPVEVALELLGEDESLGEAELSATLCLLRESWLNDFEAELDGVLAVDVESTLKPLTETVVLTRPRDPRGCLSKTSQEILTRYVEKMGHLPTKL